MEIEILLSHIFECTRTELYINNITIDENAERLCDLLVQRRLSGEPLQYITGHSEFMELDFTVNKDVFIPRPETELLVREVSLLALSRQLSTNRSLRILDLCTGCGNIAISLARLMPAAEIVATDISGPSLEIAEENSIIHGVNKNIAFYKGDLFQALPRSKSAPEVRHPALSVEGQDYFERGLPFDKKYKFDIIVCNPPYIKSLELGFLQKEVRFEPRISLDGGLDGLEFYRRIAKTAPAYLKTKGSLFLEIGFGQSKYVKDIFSSGGLFAICKVQKDFANIERVIWISLF